MTLTTNGLRLDTNGLAANTGSGGTSIPTCAVVGGELLAQTNYNGVAVKLALVTGGRRRDGRRRQNEYALRSWIRECGKRVRGDFAVGDFRAFARRRCRARFGDGLRFAHRAGSVGGGAG